MISEKLKNAIRDVHDFPKPGIIFKDITPLLHDAALCSEATEEFIKKLNGIKIDAIIGIESRGFLFGFLLANKMGLPFILIRKAGKLPYKKVTHVYNLEYGSGEVEMHIDSVKPHWNILIHDDLLATGGTADAAASLVKMQGANVAGFSFIVELNFLKGREKLESHSENIISLVNY